MTRGRLFITINLAMALAFLGLLLAAPIAFDTIHLDDTVLLANLGWRGVNGMRPVLDFPHFYGGVTAQFMTWAFQLFGVSYRAVNFGIAMMGGASVLTLWALCRGRIPAAALSLLTVLAAALVLSLAPIELGRINTPRVSHAFVYNHTGIVLMMGLSVFALRPAAGPWQGAVTALVAGLAAYGLVMLKTTFAVFLPPMLLACLLQGRWRAVALMLAGAGLTMLALDPGMARVSGSFEHLMASAAAGAVASPTGVVARVLHILTEEAVTCLLVAVLLAMLIRRDGRAGWRFVLAAVLCAMGYGGTLISMGGQADYKLLPMLVVLAVLVADRLSSAPPRLAGPERRAARHAPAGAGFPAGVLAAGLAYVLVLPALASAAAGAAMAFAYRDGSLIASGPAAGYVVEGRVTGRRADLPGAVARVDRIIADAPESFDDSMEYVMFADGIALLQGVPGIEGMGIIPNGRMFDFSTPVMAPPVRSFPVWPTDAIAGVAGDAPLGGDVDVVMLSRDVAILGLVNDALTARMGADFVPCRSSVLWTMYIRRDLAAGACTD